MACGANYRGAKRIKPTHRPNIENIKIAIRRNFRGFDGDGYAFKTAFRELRREGLKIVFDKDACLYRNLGRAKGK